MGHRAEAALKELAALNDKMRQLTRRPISITCGGDGSNWLPLHRLKMFDVFFLEWEPWGPRRPNVHLFPYHRDRNVASIHLPQMYDDNPYELVRFELYQSVIEGARGFHGIHGFGDQTLFRALAGEVRGLEPYIFSHDSPAVSAVPDIRFRATKANGKIGIIATNAAPVIGGDWVWRTDNKASGKASHTGRSSYTPRQTAAGFNHHGFWGAKPIKVSVGDVLSQSVFVPQSPRPRGIYLLAEGDGNWNHIAYWGESLYDLFAKSFGEDELELNPRFWLAAHLYNMAWGTHFTGDIMMPNVFPESCFQRMGDLPPGGKWTELEVPTERIGLTGKLLAGCCFMEYGGSPLWDRTALLTKTGQVRKVLCDDSVGIPKPELSSVRFSVPGLKAGTRVTVMFEGREIVAQDGFFVDSFEGIDGYGETSGGVLGDYLCQYTPIDKFPTNPKSGYAYNNGKIACHAYEFEAPSD